MKKMSNKEGKEEWEEHPGRKVWSLKHRFYKPMLGRYGLAYWEELRVLLWLT